MMRVVLFSLLIVQPAICQETAADWFARKMRERVPYQHQSSPTIPLGSYESRWGEYDRNFDAWKLKRARQHAENMRDYERILGKFRKGPLPPRPIDRHPLFPTDSHPDAPRAIDVPDWMRASCRITVHMNNGYRAKGSGAVFDETPEAYYVLTNAHVAATQSCYVEFWREGRRSIPIPAPRVWHRMTQTADLAILRVDKRRLFGFRIPAIPLGDNAAPGDQILSAGNANAAWQTAWSGQIQQYASEARVTFVPMPAPGRSGSPLFSADGKTIVGVIGWRSDGGNLDGQHERDGHGYAMPAGYIKGVISER